MIMPSIPFGSEPALSRRDFLVGTAAVATAACRRRPYDPRQFARPDRSTVGLFAADAYGDSLAAVMYRGLAEFGLPVAGLRVLLKPNMVEFERETAINTHPAVVAAAAEAFLRLGAAEVMVGEGPGHRRDVEYLLDASGLFGLLRDRRLTFVDLNHDDVVWTTLKSHYTGLAQIALPVELRRAQFVVSMPKLKTHHWAMLTAGMKNLFGVVPGAVYGWPKNVLHLHGIDNSILDLAATVAPHFTIVDGVVGMEGDGPIMGRPRHVGVLAMGSDVVAVDATCARLIGLDPAGVPYLDQARRFLGNIDHRRIDMRGEPLARFATRFEMPKPFAGWRAAG
jgi:uncharacterized protein (DUF362 family)